VDKVEKKCEEERHRCKKEEKYEELDDKRGAEKRNDAFMLLFEPLCMFLTCQGQLLIGSA